MAATCLDCVRKHLGAADGLLDETHLGYPAYRWKAAGQLHLAESECLALYPDFAKKIRQCRLKVMESHESSFTQLSCIEDLIREACVLAGEDDIQKEDPNNSKKFEYQIRKEEFVRV